jgi:hypothetical protein
VYLETVHLGPVQGTIQNLVDQAVQLQSHSFLIPLFQLIKLGKTEQYNPTQLGKSII